MGERGRNYKKEYRISIYEFDPNIEEIEGDFNPEMFEDK